MIAKTGLPYPIAIGMRAGSAVLVVHPIGSTAEVVCTWIVSHSSRIERALKRGLAIANLAYLYYFDYYT